ncbi:MAG: hypothetical protein VX245_04365, partial [Pseudomonadota bacterium]|nr:hypothetical protein [Pseudomonadota bacterium]
EVERSRAKISVLIKEGDYEGVNRLYKKTLDRHGQDLSLNDEYFEFLTATGNKEDLPDFADDYMAYKLHKGHQAQLKRIYNQTRSVVPDFKPTSHEVRFTLAQDYASFGDYPAVIRLVNGMHQGCSDNQLLIKAYSLMHEALQALKKEEMALRCKKLLNRLEAQAV